MGSLGQDHVDVGRRIRVKVKLHRRSETNSQLFRQHRDGLRGGGQVRRRLSLSRCRKDKGVGVRVLEGRSVGGIRCTQLMHTYMIRQIA